MSRSRKARKLCISRCFFVCYTQKMCVLEYATRRLLQVLPGLDGSMSPCKANSMFNVCSCGGPWLACLRCQGKTLETVPCNTQSCGDKALYTCDILHCTKGQVPETKARSTANTDFGATGGIAPSASSMSSSLFPVSLFRLISYRLTTCWYTLNIIADQQIDRPSRQQQTKRQTD